MKKKYLITFYRLFNSNYYIIRTIKAKKSTSQGYKECAKFAILKHLLKLRCIAFKITLLK